MKMILQKAISQSGYCSRRQADSLIRQGAVKVNGQRAIIGQEADPDKDSIMIAGRKIEIPSQKIYIKLNKPSGYVCTNRKFKGEKNIFSLIKQPERLFTIGRLDKNSRGLILLTNDGDLTQKLSHPKFKHKKVYQVTVAGELKNPSNIINNFLKGFRLEGETKPAQAKAIRYLQNNTFIITLTQGQKRQIRLMFKKFGLNVTDLNRIKFAGIELGTLKEGRWEYLSAAELVKFH